MDTDARTDTQTDTAEYSSSGHRSILILLLLGDRR
jgi:hypothetical protein